MFSSTQTELAHALQQELLADRTDKFGDPEWQHSHRVAQNVIAWPGFDEMPLEAQEAIVCAAYLHNLVEYTDITPADLQAKGFSTETIELVSLLTREDAEGSVEAYCDGIIRVGRARTLKLADLADNCNKEREQKLRDRGESVNSSVYTYQLSLLKPNQQELRWFYNRISVPLADFEQ